jgi:HAD superfamily hydrolase (TIGR01509 family)
MSKIYIFDMDGTLIDSMCYYLNGVLSILDEENISHDNEIANKVTVLGYTGSANFFTKIGVKGTVGEIYSRIERKLLPDYANNIKLKDGVKDYLTNLKSAGARLFILTGSPHSAVNICLKNNGIIDYFEKIWSVEDFGLSKSDKQLYSAVSQIIGCKNEDVTFFDDNVLAIKTANAVGYYTYGVLDRQTSEDIAEIEKSANKFIHSFKELL